MRRSATLPLHQQQPGEISGVGAHSLAQKTGQVLPPWEEGSLTVHAGWEAPRHCRAHLTLGGTTG